MDRTIQRFTGLLTAYFCTEQVDFVYRLWSYNQSISVENMSDSWNPRDHRLKDNTDASRDPVQSRTQLDPSPSDASQDTLNSRVPLIPIFEDTDASRDSVHSGYILEDPNLHAASQDTLNSRVPCVPLMYRNTLCTLVRIWILISMLHYNTF